MKITASELKKRRLALEMTQEQLAEALSVAPNTVARWERNERQIPPFLDLALETVERMGKRKEKAQPESCA